MCPAPRCPWGSSITWEQVALHYGKGKTCLPARPGHLFYSSSVPLRKSTLSSGDRVAGSVLCADSSVSQDPPSLDAEQPEECAQQTSAEQRDSKPTRTHTHPSSAVMNNGTTQAADPSRPFMSMQEGWPTRQVSHCGSKLVVFDFFFFFLILFGKSNTVMLSLKIK